MTEIRTVRAQSPTDLVAVAPTVLGFHPRDSLVLLSVGGAGMHARVDLPDEADVTAVAAHLEGVVGARGVERVALLGYCDERDPVERLLVALVPLLAASGVEVVAALRVTDGTWHPHDRDGVALGVPGTAYDLTAHPWTLDALLRDQVVHRDREALVASLDPVPAEALARVLGLTRAWAGRRSERALGQEARWVQRRVRRAVRDGVPPDDADLARLLAGVSDLRVRDVAWAEMRRETASQHVRLWADAVRRAPRTLRAAPAGLLAFAAWLAGDGALAWCAIDRCREVDPGYSMTGLVGQALQAAMPPTSWRPVPSGDLPVLTAAASDDRLGEQVHEP